MAPGDSAGMQGVWAGTDYANTSAITGVNNSARAYRNRTDPIMTPFAAGATFGTLEAHFELAYTRATRTLNLNYTAFAADGTATAGNDPLPSLSIGGDDFPTAGTITYTGPDAATGAVQSVIISGTYQGAEGDYHCSGANCMATATVDGIDLAGRWHFVHDEGASVTHLDPNYLYFGWWLLKTPTGVPAAASAFTGVAGTINVPMSDATTVIGPDDVSGSATYAGPAAGKFAISNPIGADSAGHFTADAMLTATFGAVAAPNNGGVTGMLDNFMLNDSEEDAGWSVTLLRTVWGDATSDEAADWTTQMPATDLAATAYDETMVGTIWSIDGSAADASGSWSASFVDETQGAADDGSNVPTSATGTFHSEFGEFVSMVGAFGAERTE